MTNNITLRSRKHREMLRGLGLRPVQIWVEDSRSQEFQAEALRQSRLAAKADAEEGETLELMDKLLDDAESWH